MPSSDNLFGNYFLQRPQLLAAHLCLQRPLARADCRPLEGRRDLQDIEAAQQEAAPGSRIDELSINLFF